MYQPWVREVTQAKPIQFIERPSIGWFRFENLLEYIGFDSFWNVFTKRIHKYDTQWYTIHQKVVIRCGLYPSAPPIPTFESSKHLKQLSDLPRCQPMGSRLHAWSAASQFSVRRCTSGREPPATESWFSFSATMTTNTYEYSFYNVL